MRAGLASMRSAARSLAPVLLAGGLLMALFLHGRAAADEEMVLNVYNLPDYIGENTIADFEKLTGIRVNYDVYDSDATLETKLEVGHSGYDVVVVSDGFVGKEGGAGLFRPLDKAELPNLKNIDPAVLRAASVFDPGNALTVPYFWGTIGIGMNVLKIQARMPDAPVDSLNMVFKPELVKKFADCGVAVLDDPGDMLEVILNYLGFSPYTAKKADYKAAEDLLKRVRPYIKYFHPSRYADDMANGEICLAIGWNGDFQNARRRAEEAKNGILIDYRIPVEGTQIWIDNLAIPADAQNPVNAHRFINYLMEPQVAADGANLVNYASPNLAATPMVKDALRYDPDTYPDPDAMAKLFPDKPATPAVERLRSRTWARIKEGE
jgi:putrescine transport system substrate-binding protein